jgi:steroid delta-isomerase-like uncharacterized protein
MRRCSIVLSVVVILGFSPMFGLMSPLVAAQGGTPEASPPAVPALLQRWLDAVNHGDAPAVGALYAPDAIHEDIPGEARVLGQDGIAAFVAGVLQAFEDVHLEPVSAQQSGDLGVLEYRFTAIDRQSGQPLDFRGVIVFEFAGDQIQRSADYYDVATILGQLGLLEPSEGDAPATPAA